MNVCLPGFMRLDKSLCCGLSIFKMESTSSSFGSGCELEAGVDAAGGSLFLLLLSRCGAGAAGTFTAGILSSFIGGEDSFDNVVVAGTSLATEGEGSTLVALLTSFSSFAFSDSSCLVGLLVTFAGST